jgi:hypothetical protein
VFGDPLQYLFPVNISGEDASDHEAMMIITVIL